MEYDNNSNTVTYKKANGFGNRTFTIFLFLLALFFGIVSIFVGTRNGAYNANDLRDYSEKQYSEIYDKKSNYSEYSNVLVTFITYPNEKDYDLLIKRDKEPGLFYSYDFKEGSYSTFKSYLENTIPESNGYGSRLLVYFTNAIRHLTDTYQKNKYSSDNRYGNPSKSVLINNTDTPYKEGESSLKEALNTYHKYANTNVSFVIAKSEDIYRVNMPLLIVFLSITGFLVIFGFISLSINSKDKNTLKPIEDSNYSFSPKKDTISNNNSSDPFAEYDNINDPFEEYSKNNLNK